MDFVNGNGSKLVKDVSTRKVAGAQYAYGPGEEKKKFKEKMEHVEVSFHKTKYGSKFKVVVFKKAEELWLDANLLQDKARAFEERYGG